MLNMILSEMFEFINSNALIKTQDENVYLQDINFRDQEEGVCGINTKCLYLATVSHNSFYPCI